MNDYKLGDSVKIFANLSGHNFQIGDIVYLTEWDDTVGVGYWTAADGNDFWYVKESDFIKVDQE